MGPWPTTRSETTSSRVHGIGDVVMVGQGHPMKLRQYLPEGTNLADYSQDQLNAIALSLNARPRKGHGWRTALELYDALIDLDQTPNGTMQ